MRKALFMTVTLLSIRWLHAWQLGVEHIGTKLDFYKNKAIALVANNASRTQNGTDTISYLQKRGFNIKYLLAPEHGFSGTVTAGTQVPHSTEKKMQIPIISLYRGNDKSQMIPQEILPNIRAIFFDLPHCGMRHYTYISTLYKLLELCATHALPIIVFDRPNPLGARMEGPLVDSELHSFISIAPIPVRYGLTIGELARYFNEHLLKIPAPLTIIPLHAYQRTHKLAELTAPLSPNIPTQASCAGYSFLGLLEEISPFFAGTKTQKPFRMLLIPEKYALTRMQWESISALLKQYQIPNTRTRLFHQKNNTWYIGLNLTFTNIEKTKSFQLLLQLIKKFKSYGIKITFSGAFDKAVGTPLIRAYLNGKLSYKQLAQTINHNLDEFYRSVYPYLLYTPEPIVTHLKTSHHTGSATYAKRYERSQAVKKSSIS